MYVPDYNDIHREHEARQHRALKRLPKCCECNQPIQDEKCFEFNGELVCPQCLVDNHRKNTDDYMK